MSYCHITRFDLMHVTETGPALRHLGQSFPLSVLGTPVKVGSPLSFLSLILVVAQAWGGGAVVRGQGGAWSARSAARTNDLDARRGSRRMLTVRADEGKSVAIQAIWRLPEC